MSDTPESALRSALPVEGATVTQAPGPETAWLNFGDVKVEAFHATEAVTGVAGCKGCDTRFVFIALTAYAPEDRAETEIANYLSLTADEARGWAADLLGMADRLDGGATRQ